MKKIESIPLYRMDEHHEAFMIWNDAIDKKYLPQSGNALLHVDQHSDMSKPTLRTPITELKKSKKEIQRFTYNELGIGAFIYPAVYVGIFDTVYWLLQKDDFSEPTPLKEYILSTYQNEGKIFQINQAKPSASGSVCFKRRDLTIEESLKVNQSLVLDIDVDYFSCNPYQNKLIQLEITQKQFEDFNNNKYHPLRFEYSCYTKRVADQYFMVFNQSEDIVIRSDAMVSDSQVIERINVFGDWLKRNQIAPAIIDICRDTYAGYVPDSQRKLIEDNIITKLEQIYSIQHI